MIDKLQNFMKWASMQVFKTNPPKEQHMEHVKVEIVPAKKPRKKKESTNVTN